MKAILFDSFSGASGDMTTACLIDLGADAGKVKETMETSADVDVEVQNNKERHRCDRGQCYCEKRREPETL